MFFFSSYIGWSRSIAYRGLVHSQSFDKPVKMRWGLGIGINTGDWGLGIMTAGSDTQPLACWMKATAPNPFRNIKIGISNFLFTVHIDLTRAFNTVLPQQTQPADSFSGDKTITANYTTW